MENVDFNNNEEQNETDSGKNERIVANKRMQWQSEKGYEGQAQEKNSKKSRNFQKLASPETETTHSDLTILKESNIDQSTTIIMNKHWIS